jgi:hypothetical protein
MKIKNKTKFKINDYAKSMFYFEKLNPSWIYKCKKYLNYIFKSKIKNSIVVDYAFGNGNWSVAFQKLGAKEVIAVDYSGHNVEKFKTYLKKNKINNIKVIKGDILDVNLKKKIDIFWVYGIFHHIENINKLISNIKKYWKNSNTSALIYTYNKYSLRELIVNFSRKHLIYKNYSEFKKNSFRFSNFSRLRVRDDVVVNYIKWYSKYELINCLKNKKMYGYRFIKSFDSFLGNKNYEFNPHQLLVTQKKSGSLKIKKENYSFDLIIVDNLLKLVLKKIRNKKELKNISIGILNSHFNGNYSDYTDNLTRVVLFLFYVAKAYNLKGITNIQKNILNILNLIYLNKNLNKTKLKLIKRSVLLKNLYKKKIRI